MKIISSEAGERFARAKLALTAADQWERALDPCPARLEALSRAHDEFNLAAHAVADELVAQGFGNAEGD